MGIRVFYNPDKLRALGFVLIEVRTLHSNFTQIEDWCLQNLQDEFHIQTWWHGGIDGFFRRESDAMLFRLKWA